MYRRLHFVRTVIGALLLSVLGCGEWDQSSVLTGHFFMRTASGTIRLYLMPGGRMEETLTPSGGLPIQVAGTWKVDGPYMTLTPFADWGSGSSIERHVSRRALAEYDHKHNLQLLIYEDRGAYFEREHPFTLATGRSSPTHNA